MGGMWYVLGAAALVAVILAAVSVLRRPSAEDLSSVRHYHSALGTLEHLSERSVRPVPDDGEPGEDRPVAVDGQPRFYRRPDAPGPLPAGIGPGGEDEPPARLSPRSSARVPPATIRGEVPEPGSPIVFDDARPRDRFESGQTPLSPRARVDRVQRHALESMNHRPRRGLVLTAVAVVAVVLFTVLAIVGSQRAHRHSTGAVTSTTAGHTSATVRPPAGSAHHRTTTTTAPAQLVASSSTASTALYTVGASSFHLGLSTSGPCWVNATTASTGSTLWTGTMQAGGSQDIPATGTTRLELGTLAVAVTVDGVPVAIPASIHSPFVLTFEPSPSASAGTPTSSTTTTAIG
jgi:RodZ C-terminal domain